MGNALVRIPDALVVLRDQNIVACDDFPYYVNADNWTVLTETNTTAAHEGSVGKTRVQLACLNNDNNEAGIFTTNECLKFVAGKNIMIEGLIDYSEAATNAANVAFAMADALGANFITDNGAALAINDTGAAIYKVDGETVWRFGTRIAAGTQTITQSTTTAGGGPQTLRIEGIWRSSTVIELRPYVDGVQLKDSNGVGIMHTITLGTSTDMDFGVYCKQGTTANQSVYVDYLFATQDR